MNSTVAVLLLILWLSIAGGLSLTVPNLLSDKNTFLAGFVNHEFLSFMGVIVTITLASATNLFMELLKLEDRAQKEVFRESKRDVRHSAYALLCALGGAVVLVVVKPLVGTNASAQSFVNGVALGILMFSILILIDLTLSAFETDPRAK